MYYVLQTIKKNTYLCIVKELKTQQNSITGMRNIFFVMGMIAAMLTAAVAEARSAAQLPSSVTGRVEDSEGRAIAYATVVAMHGERQAAGTTTDDDGRFVLALADGEYTLTVEFLGYKSAVRRLEVSGSADTGTTVLETDTVAIEGVEVTAQIIRREADRFVVDVANMPSAIGKDGVDLLRNSPGIFINDDTISINGKSGTKVYINDREVKYTGDRLLSYLRNLRSEEIQKIEVVPIAGADFDANSSAGIIKITLKRRRDDGIMGSFSVSSSINDLRQAVQPTGFVDYRTGKWTLSASGYYAFINDGMLSSERQTYPYNDNLLTSNSKQSDDIMHWYGAKAGALYDINDNHSVGAEVEVNGYDTGWTTTTYSNLYVAALRTNDESDGLYHTVQNMNSVSARFNYIGRLDTLGSTVKVLADYTRQSSDSGNDYNVAKRFTAEGMAPVTRDSIYRDNAGTGYNITSVSVDYHKVFSGKFNLKVGGKYTNNLMAADSRYDYLLGDAWQTRPTYNYDVKYTENIAAAYFIASSQLGRWSISAGLRGEYTASSGRSLAVRQNYFSLFPNASVSFALKKDNSYSLVAQYARTISRPNFWDLSPNRTQVSEYLYQVGNPELNPSFDNSLMLSLVMKYKYTISLGVSRTIGQMTQIIMVSDDDPDTNCVRAENLDRTDNCYIQLSLPFQFFKWWSANFNVSGIYRGMRIRPGEPQRFNPMLYANVSTTFNLPKNFFINIDYNYNSKNYVSNISVEERHLLGFSVKKRMLDDRLTLSVGAYNLIPEKFIYTYSDKSFERVIKFKNGWQRTSFSFSLSYNFNRGKKFDKKTLESSADSSRLSK